MRRIFVDTYYWIALLNDRDQGHAAARAISQTLPQPGIVTTQEVLSEVLTYFCAHGRQVRQTVVAFIRQILTDPAITARNPGRVDLGGFPPRPPTDPDVHVNASGSSSQDFAAPLSRPWTTRAGGRR